jgi:hypothetical protein
MSSAYLPLVRQRLSSIAQILERISQLRLACASG